MSDPLIEKCCIMHSMTLKIGIFLILLCSLGCGVNPPPRPSNVPAEAIWAGGSDGGAWIQCSPLSGKWEFHCIVYRDEGELWAKGTYYLRHIYWDKAQNKTIYSLPQYRPPKLEYSWFNGDEIRLADSMVLLGHGNAIH